MNAKDEKLPKHLEQGRKLVLDDPELRGVLGPDLDELIRKARTVLKGRKHDTPKDPTKGRSRSMGQPGSARDGELERVGPRTRCRLGRRSANGKAVLLGGPTTAINAQGCDAIARSFTDSYASWTPGAAVSVKDEHGTIIGSDSLDGGTVSSGQNGMNCTFGFSIPAVSRTATFYEVAIGSVPAVSFSHAQVSAETWYLTINSPVSI